MPAQTCTVKQLEQSGNLGNSRGLHHWRAALALRETCGFILVCVNAPELFPVGVENTDEEMVMFAATIFAE
jgi:hypothetical protein